MTHIIDLSKLPTINIVEQKSSNEILEERLTYLKNQGVDVDNFTPSDPIYRNLLASSYRESLVRQDANEQTLGNMLAFATDSQLDQLAANPIYNLTRLDGESNEAFKRRIQLSPEAFSVAGPEGKYIFEALSASADVKDASFDSPAPMHGNVFILSSIGDGTPDQALLDVVSSHLMDDGVRPQTDLIAVVSPTILNYSITAKLTIASGPDSSEVLNQARKRIQLYVDTQHQLNGQVVVAGVYGALMVEGVVDVNLTDFVDVKATKLEAPYCTGLNIT